MRPVGDAIQQRLTQQGFGDHLGPFGKGQVGRHDHGGHLGEFGDDLEAELGSQLCCRYGSELCGRSRNESVTVAGRS
jgi:hypothetical protein